jgi:myo-inositol 2-dehydrogenase/D-chiro-inositol 1-dehydrogenase
MSQLKSRISLPETQDRNDPYLAEVSHFVECVRTDHVPQVTFEDALRSCEIAFRAMDSARSGAPLAFDKTVRLK